MSIFKVSTLLLFVSMSWQLHAGISSQIDKQAIEQGETFRLFLSITKNDAAQVDLSPLDKNFEVVSRSHQSSTRIINGSIESSTKLVITLAPKRAGNLEIPALSLAGEESQAHLIEVKKVEQLSAIDGGVELLSTLSEKAPRVQQPTIYQMNLVLGQRIFNAAFQEPQVKQGKALIEPLGEQKQYRQTLNGREMLVIEQSWMITPQQSGVLEIEGAQLSAEVQTSQAQRDPYRRFNSPRGMRRIFVSADSYTLNVESIPSSFTGAEWLTASELELTQQLSTDNWKQGEPVTRTITLEAKGMSEAQLPRIQLPEVDGLKQYAAKPSQEQVYADNELVTKMVLEVTLIPSRLGKLEIPEFRLPWWDTTTNSQKVAVIPAQSVNVLPVEGQNAVHINKEPPTNSSLNDQTKLLVMDPEVKGESTSESPLLLNAKQQTIITDTPNVVEGVSWLLFLFGCLISLVLGVVLSFFVMKKRVEMAPSDNKNIGVKLSSFSFAELKKACTDNDPQAARCELLKWLKHYDPSITHLNNLDGVVSAALLDEISKLNRCNFASQETTWSGGRLLDIVSEMQTKQPGKQKKVDALMPLYTK